MKYNVTHQQIEWFQDLLSTNWLADTDKNLVKRVLSNGTYNSNQRTKLNELADDFKNALIWNGFLSKLTNKYK